MTAQTKRVFSHPSANSTTIMPNGHKIVFAGAITGKGDARQVGMGFYETDKQEEIEWLDALVKSRSTMIAEVLLTPEQVTVLTEKREDPAIKQATADAAANTATDTNPSVTELREKLAQMAVAGAKQDGIVMQQGQVVQAAPKQ